MSTEPSFRHVIGEKAGRSVRLGRPASPFVGDLFIVPDVAAGSLRLAVINRSVVALVPALIRSLACRAVVSALFLALTLSDATISAQTLSVPSFRVMAFERKPAVLVPCMAILSRSP